MSKSYERGILTALILWLCLVGYANAQTAVTPAPVPKLQFLSSTGAPLAGGKVCTFQAGTSTPLTTYSESTGTSANTNPITLDSGGFANIWFTNAAYKIIVYSSVGADGNCPNAGVQQYSVDGINPTSFGKLSLSGITDPAAALGLFWLSTTTAGRIKWSDASAIHTITGNDTTDTLTNKTLTSPTINTPTITTPAVTGTETHSGQIQSSLASGTAPLSITSTTPVANLSATPTTYNHSGTQATNAHVVIDVCTLGTDCAVTLAGSAVFTSNASYRCAGTDGTAANAVKWTPSSGSAFTFTGTGTDVIHYFCAGN